MSNESEVLRFSTVEEYLRTMHPEYAFVFELADHARERWHYDPVRAEQTQAHMIENAFEVALRSDRADGREIVIEQHSGNDKTAP